MEYKQLAYGLVIGLLLGGIGGYVISNSLSDSTDLINEIEEYETERAFFTSQISEYEAIISNFSQTIVQHENEISSLETAMESLSATVSDSRNLDIYFGRTGEVTEKLISWIDSANESISVIVTMIDEASLGEALVDAYERGVDVQVLMDRTYEHEYNTRSIFEDLILWGVDTREYTHTEQIHEQTMIIDSEIVVLGSFDWGRRFGEGDSYSLVKIVDNSTTQKALEMFENRWRRTNSLLPVLEHLEIWPELVEGTIVISEIETDPPGDDLSREWIEFYNPWNFSVDISGYWLFFKKMDYNNTFPQGTIIRSKEYFVSYLPVEVDNDIRERIYFYNSEGVIIDHCTTSDSGRDDDTSTQRIGKITWQGAAHTKGRPNR
jgi:hypothetical protein